MSDVRLRLGEILIDQARDEADRRQLTALIRARQKVIDALLDELVDDDTARLPDRCGAPLRGGHGSVCGLPANHVDSPSESYRKHRSTESLRRRRGAS